MAREKSRKVNGKKGKANWPRVGVALGTRHSSLGLWVALFARFVIVDLHRKTHTHTLGVPLCASDPAACSHGAGTGRVSGHHYALAAAQELRLYRLHLDRRPGRRAGMEALFVLFLVSVCLIFTSLCSNLCLWCNFVFPSNSECIGCSGIWLRWTKP
jgi:hypothetical protein